MRRLSQKALFLNIVPLVTLLVFVVTLRAQSAPQARASWKVAERKTARYFDSIHKSPPQQWAFMLRMPKGADLHNHLSGAVYAESYIQWAAESGLCVDIETMALLPPQQSSRCENDPTSQQPPVSLALTNSVIYRTMIDAWSMRNWQLSGQSGHDHFFDAFGKFGPATFDNSGKMLAEAVTSAARGRVFYVELMLTPDGTPTGVASSQIGEKVGWDGNPESTLSKLKANGI